MKREDQEIENAKLDATHHRVIAALLTPTIEAMRQAGISRLGIERDKSILLQMDDGEVIGPIKAHAAFERVFR
jgi:hypothetical protein